MNRNYLMEFGWDLHFEDQLSEQYAVGRVLLEHKHTYRIICEDGEYVAELTGKFRFEAIEKGNYPAVGDWVSITKLPEEKKAMIHTVLPRKSSFSNINVFENVPTQIVVPRLSKNISSSIIPAPNAAQA